ncbi:MAG: hypothetical protein EA351_14970 [Gemmatimonadales bacterium]|nr:MAG: hypothetical protein EA351_14970 [Gemmatimonadales bacterium]
MSSTLPDAGTEGLLFRFRASDPSVYQDAAIELGGRLLDDPPLRQAMESYAERHGLGLSGTIPLRGVRGPRRILLLRSSARARWISGASRGDWEPEDPLPIDARFPLPDSPRDTAVRLLAERLLFEVDPDTRYASGLHLVAGATLEERRRWDRASLRRWGELAGALARARPNEGLTGVLEAWRRLVQRFLGEYPTGPGASVVRRVQLLALLDEAARGLTALPEAVAVEALRGVGEETMSSGPSRRESRSEGSLFLEYRHRLWAIRTGHLGHSPGAGPMTSDGKPAGSLLGWMVGWADIEWEEATPGRSWRTFDPAEPGTTRRRAALRRLLRPLASPSEWSAYSPHQRSLRAFLILDVLSDATEGDPELTASARAEGVLDEGGEDSLGVLALRVTSLESPGGEAMIDPAFLHRVTGDGLLLALIPAGRRSELLPVLADGIEHRLRLRLASDPHADAERDLMRVSVRSPHSEFWEALEALVGGRSYPLADGGELELESLVNRARDRGLPREAILVESLAGLEARGEGVGVGGELRTLAGLVEGRTRVEGESLAGLLSLVLWINRGRSHCLSRRAVAGEGPGVDALEAQCEDWARRLREIGEAISTGTAGAEDVLAARSLFDELRGSMAPLLPAAVAEALLGALDRLERPLSDEWAALNLLDTLRSEHGGEAQTGVGFVVWLLDRPVEERLTAGGVAAWRVRVAGLWGRSILEAMEHGYESRVRALVHAEGLDVAGRRSIETTIPLLEQVRRWWFDRYAMVEGHRVSLLMSRIDGRSRSAIADLGRFLTVFSPLWVALLIGAILMLDFGDAWRAMVEAEDLRGILITFLVGSGGALAYLAFELRRKVTPSPEDRGLPGSSTVRSPSGFPWGRLLGFFGASLVYTLAVTSLMWLLLSRTDEVVHGAWAPAHIFVWAGFALFAGVFFGMLAKE